MDDFVMIENEKRSLKFAQIHCIYVDTITDNMVIEMKWIYRQLDTASFPYHGSVELFDSNDFESFSCKDIDDISISTCKIEPFKTFINRNNFPNDVYYISDIDYFDAKLNKLCKRNNNTDFETSKHRKLLNKYLRRISLEKNSKVTLEEPKLYSNEATEDAIIYDLEVLADEETSKDKEKYWRISKEDNNKDLLELDLSSDSDELDINNSDIQVVRTTPRKNAGINSKLKNIKEKIQSFPTVNDINLDDDIIIDEDIKPESTPNFKREYSKDDWLASVEFSSRKSKKRSIIDSDLPNSTRLNLERVKLLSDRSKKLNNFNKWDFDKETKLTPVTSPKNNETKYIELSLNTSILHSNKKRKKSSPKKKQSAKISPINIEGIQLNYEDTKERFFSNHKRDNYNDSQEDDPEMSDFIVADDATLSQYDDGLEVEDSLLSNTSLLTPEKEQSQDEVTSFLNHFSITNLKTAFKIYIQYLISSIIEPGFSEDLVKSNDSYFTPALKKIKNSILDYKQIVVASSVWNRNFKEDLDQLPNYGSHKIEAQASCDVCSRSNRISTYQVTLSGVRYNSQKLWDGNWSEYYELSNYDKIESVTYFMGRFCHTRTKLYHKLNHFQYKLAEGISNKINKSSNDDKVSILEEILDDEKWISRRYREYEELKEMIDEFRSSAHSEEEG